VAGDRYVSWRWCQGVSPASLSKCRLKLVADVRDGFVGVLQQAPRMGILRNFGRFVLSLSSMVNLRTYVASAIHGADSDVSHHISTTPLTKVMSKAVLRRVGIRNQQTPEGAAETDLAMASQTAARPSASWAMFDGFFRGHGCRHHMPGS
jgi:hypothetical protein